MAIEVRQMVVKSTIVSGDDSSKTPAPRDDQEWAETFKEEILAACRRLIEDERVERAER